MRLWTLHPRYLDRIGLVALWREALLAKAVLRGRTTGYRHHPQLDRFRLAPHPVAAVNSYLAAVHDEAKRRGYRFNARLLAGPRTRVRLGVNRGQVAFEWQHLLAKLRRRDAELFSLLHDMRRPAAHPLFRTRPGPVETWERP
ncbi:MAG TPA: pyrimidine dimer DNA glycosylase/endonuclease V [Gemmatimonadaceae bacterium]|nr:pyrimidine dimer DNA glycosylase/endonuclease V [Gemmatimonadaceae bacterium]